MEKAEREARRALLKKKRLKALEAHEAEESGERRVVGDRTESEVDDK